MSIIQYDVNDLIEEIDVLRERTVRLAFIILVLIVSNVVTICKLIWG